MLQEYAFFRLIGEPHALVTLGLVSFAGAGYYSDLKGDWNKPSQRIRITALYCSRIERMTLK